MESEENAERQANSLDHGPGIKSKKSELHGKKQTRKRNSEINIYKNCFRASRTFFSAA